MKIDLHCHTLKVKQGDKETRNVDKTKFKQVMTSNCVDICAITNHNKFDKKQYLEFVNYCNNEVNIWPGVELDVNVNGEKGHILFISNPDDVDVFDLRISEIIGNENVDTFCIDYDKLINRINDLDLILIAHYLLLKKEGFSDKSISLIKELLDDKIPFLLEPSNLKSVGIMYAHDLDGFIGSDVQDWDNYPASKVPSLKMRVKDYRTFKLLLKKDNMVIDTFLNQKAKQLITIKPFTEDNDFTNVEVPIYNDVNVIFGGKGTGKSKILKAIKEYFENKGLSNSLSYYKATENNALYKEMTELPIEESMFEKLELDDLKTNFQSIKNWNKATIVPTSLFYKGVKSLKVKGKITKFGFFKASYSYIENTDDYDNLKKDYENIKEIESKKNSIKVSEYLTLEESKDLNALVKKLKDTSFMKMKSAWIDNKAKFLLDKTIKIMQQIGKIKTGEQAVPASTGISEFYSNLLGLYTPVKSIYNSLCVEHKIDDERLGYIPEKGNVYLRKEYYINPDEELEFEDVGLKYCKNKMKKTDLKNMKNTLNKIKKNLFKKDCSLDLGTLINTYFQKADSLKDCFSFRCFTIIKENGEIKKYDPSDGEKSMLQIHNSLISNEKSIFILDEPELSVGHNYINSVVVPRIKELALLDKIVIISTHDSNIAVRTLPINSIYREYKKTFIGNLFIDELISEDGTKCKWTDKSLEYLEGGIEAFLERGDSYGV